MLATIAFAEKSDAAKIHLNVVALKILQMLLLLHLSLQSCKEKKCIHE